MKLNIVVFYISVIMCACSCSTRRTSVNLVNNVTSAISDDARWPSDSFYSAFDQVESGDPCKQFVSIRMSHDGNWTIRDRQLLNNGSVIIIDYSIWINDENPELELLNRYVIKGKQIEYSNMHSLISMYMELFRQEISGVRQSKFIARSKVLHAVPDGAAFGEYWPKVYLDDSFSDFPAAPLSLLLELNVISFDNMIIDLSGIVNAP